jgi:hypothetical protein
MDINQEYVLEGGDANSGWYLWVTKRAHGTNLSCGFGNRLSFLNSDGAP